MRNFAVESWERICFLYVAIFKPHSKDVIFHFDSYPLVVHCVLLFVCGSSSVRRGIYINQKQNTNIGTDHLIRIKKLRVGFCLNQMVRFHFLLFSSLTT